MNIHDIIESLPKGEIDVTLDKQYPFPNYELEVQWDVFEWNGSRTTRLDRTISQGVSINPVDYSDEDGNLNEGVLLKDAIRRIAEVLNDEDRVGEVRILG